jgi:hypothetical protein
LEDLVLKDVKILTFVTRFQSFLAFSTRFFMKNNLFTQYLVPCGLVLCAAIMRIAPHPDNFSPISAIALFGGAYFSRKSLALVVPFLALWASDLYLNNVIYAQYFEGFTWYTSLWIYAAFALAMLLGAGFLQKVTPTKVFFTSLAASLLFFGVTNFDVWINSGMYPKNMAGLVACYTAALPFFQQTLAGDLFYTSVLFGIYEWAKSSLSAPTFTTAYAPR